MLSQEGWDLISSSSIYQEEQPRKEVMWPRPSAARVKISWPRALPTCKRQHLSRLGLPRVYCLIMLVNGREKRHESPKSHCTHSHNFSFLVAFDSGSFAIPDWVRRASFRCAHRRLLSASVLAPCVAVKLFSHTETLGFALLVDTFAYLM